MGGTGSAFAWHLLIYPAMRIHDDEVVAKSLCFGQSLNSQEETGLKCESINLIEYPNNEYGAEIERKNGAQRQARI